VDAIVPVLVLFEAYIAPDKENGRDAERDGAVFSNKGEALRHDGKRTGPWNVAIQRQAQRRNASMLTYTI
jgi:hypothetical protein